MWFIYGVRILFVLNMIYLGCIGSWLNVLIVASALCTSFIPELISKIWHIHLTKFMTYFLIVFILLAQWLGTYLRAYDFISWWDIFLHGLSAILVGLAGLIILKLCDKELTILKSNQYGLISLFLFLTISASAVFWEIFEFAGDQLFGTNAQLGSLVDTMGDMIICVVVGFVFSLWIYVSLKREKDNFVTKQMRVFTQINTEEETRLESVISEKL